MSCFFASLPALLAAFTLAAAVPVHGVGTTTVLGSNGDGHWSVVRREAGDIASLGEGMLRKEAEVSRHTNRQRQVRAGNEGTVAVDSSAVLRALQGQTDDVFISPEAKAHLGLAPDAEAPRRDALRKEKEAILREQHGEASSIGAAPSLLQEASVATHRRSHGPSASPGGADDIPASNTLVAESSPHEKVPEWRKYALTEDGSPNVQLLIATSPTRGKAVPDWAKAGLAQEDLLTNFDREMTRLGKMDEHEDLRAAIEDHQARVAEDGEDDPKKPVNEAELGGYDDPTSAPVEDWRDPWAFRFYRFTPLKLRDVKSAEAVSLSEVKMWMFGVEVALNTMSIAYNALGRHPEGEDVMKAIDKNTKTKWTDSNMGSIMLILPFNAVATNFAFTTSGDHPERDPIQWYWEGSHDMKHWKMLMGQLSDAGTVSPARETMTDMFAWRVDCLVSDWHGWSKCNQNCSGGNQTRVRGIQRHSYNSGNCIADWFQLQPCNEEPCNKGIVKNGGIRGGSVGLLLWALLAAAGWRLLLVN